MVQISKYQTVKSDRNTPFDTFPRKSVYLALSVPDVLILDFVL